MNIVVYGAGAIGSLFGGLLSRQNNVFLIGRKYHVNVIRRKGLEIQGKTNLVKKISAGSSIDDISFPVDLLLLTVKSFDTEQAIMMASPIIDDHTLLINFQNGIGNLEIIKTYVSDKQIIPGITTHGSMFIRPGVIQHTGRGKTILGELNGQKTERIRHLIKCFNDAGITTTLSTAIVKDIFRKAIINASINPLTAIFQCRNGYLLKNPVLSHILEQVCIESTLIARAQGFHINPEEMCNQTLEVIRETADNYSSMVQSIQKKSQTEIDAINGNLVDIGKTYGCDTRLNQLLTKIIKSIEL